jgi:hypothetical protein
VHGTLRASEHALRRSTAKAIQSPGIAFVYIATSATVAVIALITMLSPLRFLARSRCRTWLAQAAVHLRSWCDSIVAIACVASTVLTTSAEFAHPPLMVKRLTRTMLEAQAKEALCLKRRRQRRDDSVSRSISLGLLSDPAPTENEADRGQGATSKEQAKEGGRDLAFLRDHAKRCKKAHRAASNAALLVAGQQTVPWAVQREVQRAAQRDAQRAAEASAAPATELGTAVATVGTGHTALQLHANDDPGCLRYEICGEVVNIRCKNMRC